MRDIMIRKTITLSIIGILCLTVGIAYGAATRDKTLMIMSIIICIVNVFEITQLHSLEKKHNYMTVSGKCLESVYKCAGRYRIYRIQEDDDIIEISVPKNIKLRVNTEYNLYFKTNTLETEEHSEWLKNKILSENFLGYEEINDLKE